MPFPILIYFYWPIVYALWDRIVKDENYSFGLLLPFVIAYIINSKWPQIQNSVLQPTWLGLVVMVIGLTLNFFWILGSVAYLGFLSFFLVVIGLLILQFGFRLIRILAFPILLFFIMLPLPETLVKAVTFRLQIVSSLLAARTLQGMGYPVFLQGNVIDLGTRQLQVVEACSGMGYLISALILGIIFCYFYQRQIWKVFILLISVIPATVLANSIRLVCIAFFPFLQAGFWHMAIGLIIFILVFLYLTLINVLLNKLSPPPAAHSAMSAPEPKETSSPGFQIRRYLYTLGGLVLIILAFPVTSYLGQTQPVPLLHDFAHFPLTIGPWEGQRNYIEPAVIKVLGTDEYLEANFVSTQHGPVSLWIAYYPGQYREKGLFHSPLICLVGGGWKVLQEQQAELAPGLPVKYLLVERSGVRQVVYYWYLQSKRWLSEEYSLKIYLGLGRLLNRGNDGALVRLITPATPGVEEAQGRLRAFGQNLIPVLQQFFQLDENLGSGTGKNKTVSKRDHG